MDADNWIISLKAILLNTTKNYYYYWISGKLSQSKCIKQYLRRIKGSSFFKQLLFFENNKMLVKGIQKTFPCFRKNKIYPKEGLKNVINNWYRPLCLWKITSWWWIEEGAGDGYQFNSYFIQQRIGKWRYGVLAVSKDNEIVSNIIISMPMRCWKL